MTPWKWIVGLDYSMTCPAITIARLDTPFSFGGCQLRYLSERVPVKALSNVVGTRFMNECATNEERFDKISDWAVGSILDCVGDCPVDVYIEDYSFGSKGKVFHIAENTAIVKHCLYKLGIPIILVPPTVIKKFAFTKGNATKNQMYDAFVKETGVELLPIFQPKAESVGSPTGDLVDSFYLCKYGYVTDALTLNTTGTKRHE